MTLNRKELIHPIFHLLFISAPIIGLIFDYHSDFSEKALFVCFILIFLNSSDSVKLKGSEIIRGIHLSPFGFIKIKKRMALSDIKELSIHKNEKKYCEIIAVSDNDFLIIKTIANRIPAEEELKEIQTKINSKKQLIQNLN
ncbi:hypothetical protein SAMN06265349_101643 [Flavobacterium resistens]|uniref:PH domain-containing protein n=1 Tax=Flavobacterium resistens TaxID=443612 RepID=A0A521B3D7_9FLAO|nr:hypothetical protein [Flavobacterium resistens]MRX70347.1 hypothetical protein [Flavobacterium resistens]SMO41627.1 hypothetical protein SAMN06265349_101643 [Flavobacterium resistens]